MARHRLESHHPRCLFHQFHRCCHHHLTLLALMVDLLHRCQMKTAVFTCTGSSEDSNLHLIVPRVHYHAKNGELPSCCLVRFNCVKNRVCLPKHTGLTPEESSEF